MSVSGRGLLAVAVLPAAMLCSLQSAPPAGGPSVTPVGAAGAGAATPIAYGGCGPDSRPETGLQGQVPRIDQDSGRSASGYRCNVRLVGQNNLGARGANMQLAWYRDCAYVSIIGVREFFPQTASPLEGIAVVDATNPARPEHVQTLRSPVGRNQHEGIEVNQRRGMLVAQIGGVSARYIEIYDVSKDCRHPVLKARYDSRDETYHGLKISDDGRTVYASDGIGRGSYGRKVLDVIDVSDMSKPRLITRWGPADEQPANSYLVHDLDLSMDGTRAYLGASPPITSLVGLGLFGARSEITGPTVVTLDTSDIKARRAAPDLSVVSQVDAPNFGHTIQRARIKGRPYVIASGESPWANGINCPWAWGHLIDMGDERNPKLMSELKLEVNMAENCDRTVPDDVNYSIHYVGVDDERRTTKVFYTYYGGGVRVFDVRDPTRPKELGYYHPPPQPSTALQPLAGTTGGDAQTPAWDSATSVVRYRPETGHIWVVSIGGGFQILEGTGILTCKDRLAPRIVRRKSRISRRGIRIRGRAKDTGCNGRLARVQASVALRREGRCRFLRRSGRLGRPRSCSRRRFLRARGARRFRLRVAGRLPAGSYRVGLRAVDAAGNRGRLRVRRLRVRAAARERAPRPRRLDPRLTG